MTRRRTLHPNENQLRAGYRLLQGMLHSESPLVQRAVAEALHDSRPSDALAFVELMRGALLAESVPASLLAHVHDVLDSRD